MFNGPKVCLGNSGLKITLRHKNIAKLKDRIRPKEKSKLRCFSSGDVRSVVRGLAAGEPEQKQRTFKSALFYTPLFLPILSKKLWVFCLVCVPKNCIQMSKLICFSSFSDNNRNTSSFSFDISAVLAQKLFVYRISL